jgi:HPt (histidine-containing phosphotransfer) domain-containing protein
VADLVALLQPRIVDRDSFQEFVEALDDQVPGIERDIATLRKSPIDRALIAKLFRSLHTIKGDAAICKVDVGVMICHPIESLLARCRDGDVEFSSLLAEVLLLALDRLELTIEALALGRDVTHLNLPQLVGGLESMAAAQPVELALRAIGTIEAVTGFKPVNTSGELIPPPVVTTNAGSDLAFFRTLAWQLESRSPLFKGRTNRILQLALATNAAAGTPVDVTQLEAAVYLHDVGMMFAPESAWLKVGKLSDDDKRLLHAHPTLGADLLTRIPGWKAAADMVAQHHEMPDGRGYPAGLKAEGICPGAKILAIVDAFEAVTLKHNDRGHTRSLVRAIAEVNACDNQFATEWIQAFNTVIRQMVEA